jgi:hypothetical protein
MVNKRKDNDQLFNPLLEGFFILTLSLKKKDFVSLCGNLIKVMFFGKNFIG